MKASFSAPAKVNLALRVVGKRADGYHLLQTVMTFFPLFDRLDLELLDGREGVQFVSSPAVTDRPEDNLVFQAAEQLRLAAGVDQGVSIRLSKTIPHGGGLGGGSSDAATVLLALNAMWNIHWSVEQLIELGVTLGADIPVFLGGQGALAEGIGEQLTPLPHLPEVELVLVNPGEAISTKRVFAALAGRFPHHPKPLIPSQIVKGCLPTLLENDLEPIVREMTPTIAEMSNQLTRLGAQATLMSGSGSSLFGLFEKKEQANHAVTHLKQSNPAWKVVSGTTFNIHPFANEWKSSIVLRS
ncbi:MAG: 4-(cytidine 5'-diphospho)-2-C-methyl-D-erythritol kinase [Magnetococcales bacterium]|nr:4-(cytidine 5'-diphospho)-2-C-methyl-D-erythritol kinase [Magnetococcales bacterium]